MEDEDRKYFMMPMEINSNSSQGGGGYLQNTLSGKKLGKKASQDFLNEGAVVKGKSINH